MCALPPESGQAAGWSLRRRVVRWGRRVALALAVLVVVLGAIVGRWGWWAPPVFMPAQSVVIVGKKLTSAEHNKRVVQLDPSGYLLHLVRSPKAGPSGALLFFGALHSKDPKHAQIAALQRAWREFKPTVALVEGRMSFFVGSAAQGVGVFGEGAMVYALAEEAGVPIYTLEPPLEIEIAALRTCGDMNQVAMFRVLNGYISARRGGSVSDFKIGRLLARRATPLTDAFPDIASFDAYFASQFPTQPDWRQLPEEAMWPGKTDTLLHRMATSSNQARDEHFVRVMVDLVNRGERVLAIAGRSHTIVLEPVLWESLQPAERGELGSRRGWE